MYQGLIITDDQQIREESYTILNKFGDIKIECINSIDELDEDNDLIYYLFVLVTDLDQTVLRRITDVQTKIPGLSSIIYNHSLNFVDFPFLVANTNVKMIIGENREANLKNLIINLKTNFWRKIPFGKMGIKIDDLSPRMKNVIQYIETAPMSKCNINAISSYLNISAGYFSQEFKRETKKSFRSFMQDVIDYYENIIFAQVDLPTKSISRILGYSELSSFSRSFKKRKGISPTKFKKILNN